jgi:hypothetical protein
LFATKLKEQIQALINNTNFVKFEAFLGVSTGTVSLADMEKTACMKSSDL